MSDDKPERIAKVLARAGLCSRREAERWIADGRVKVDGKTLDTPAFTVTGANHILVDGAPLPAPVEARLWRYHKPAGLVTSHRDPEGRRTVFETLPKDLGRVISVGRLDLNSEGLLLLTNDGELARKLELPSTGWLRRYRVRVHGTVDEKALAALADGVTVAGIHYAPIEAKLDSQNRANAWLTVSLTEGKNREIRKVMEYMDLTVNRLIRLSYGPFHLGKLGRSGVAAVPAGMLAEHLGGIDGEQKSVKKRGKGWAKARPKPVHRKPLRKPKK